MTKKRAQRVQDVVLGPDDGTNRRTLCEDHASHLMDMAQGLLGDETPVSASRPYDGVCDTCLKVGTEKFRHENWTRDAAGEHGHTLGDFEPHPKGKGVAVAYCQDCGAEGMHTSWGKIGGRATKEPCKPFDFFGSLTAHFALGDREPDFGSPLVWYHGTQKGGFDTLKPQRSTHWNTDLGVHLTLNHDVAHDFATGSLYGGKYQPGPDSRIAHTTWAAKNPIHYESELHMAKDAIDWAHDNGHHLVGTSALKNHPDLHREEDAEVDSGKTLTEIHPYDRGRLEHWEKKTGLSGRVGTSQRKGVLDIDRGGLKVVTNNPDDDDYFGEPHGLRSPRTGDQYGSLFVDHYYLNHHPDRDAITSGFRQHLQDQGHDGITYGNLHEGPKHDCAIAFDPKDVKVDHWEHLGGHKTAAVLPPPLPNPARASVQPEIGGKVFDAGPHRHWYHGTDHQFYNSTEDEPGGRLEHIQMSGFEYGDNADKHWNTDLGTHFTSLPRVARMSFAHGSAGSPDSRVAHCRLHIGNPKHYDSEFDLTHHAIQWAQQNGHSYGLSRLDEYDPDEFKVGDFDHVDNHPEHAPIINHGDFEDREAALKLEHAHEEPTSHEDWDTIARGGRGDNYLRFHPEREEITSGFKQHLEDQGHDGIVYGNEYEGPKGHKCAIAFHPHQIHMDRWQWLHDNKKHLNDPEHTPEVKHTQPETLLDQHHTPAEGHHWIDSGGMKISLRREASAPMQPEYDPDAGYEHNVGARRSWRKHIREGLSLGSYTPTEARAAGYSGEGHDQDGESYDEDGNFHGLRWTKMPSPMWHVTTHRDAVLKDGAIKSRDALAQQSGLGLGGGESDTISYTDDRETAHHIHRALHEYHSMLNKSLPEATQQMMDEAHRGGYAHQVENSEGKDTIAARLKGHVRVPHAELQNLPGMGFVTLKEAREHIHPEADFQPGYGAAIPGEEPRSMNFTRPATKEEAAGQISSHYKSHTWMRAHNGGPMDPLFSQNDAHGFAKMDPSQFAVIRVKPREGARGYRLGSMSEWRTAHHDAVAIDGVEDQHPQTKTAGRRRTTDVPVSQLLEWAHPRGSDAVDEAKVQEYARQMEGSGYDEDEADENDDHIRVLDGRVLNGNHRIHAADEAGMAFLPVEMLNHREGHVLDPWEPKERLFAPTKDGVDPRLFDAQRKMLPAIRDEVLGDVSAFFTSHGYGDMRAGWARVYLAGSQASEWYGNNDFDILVGINYPLFRTAHPDLAGLSNDEIDHQVNVSFFRDFNDEEWRPRFDPDHDWHRTGYVNKDSWDIRQIRPYAAYNLTDDTWAVDPIDEPTGHQFGPTEWYYFESIAEEARRALALPEPRRAHRAAQVWTFVHTDRSRAFGPHGTGAFDRGNALEKYLDQAPSGIEGKSLMAALADARFGVKA